ncbi:thrombospondin type 3 repeat-containing protein [Rheinheimera oceanensis]|uniref:thrombospondin type 3 repeat-containing protein n=1 Tax=Rheinheimera oceanensis TaxID=2817449 RepID=UPI001BFD4032|nr:thrombospondin type 3 repeat-containing protein [Rheinheimera oceanensis]
MQFIRYLILVVSFFIVSVVKSEEIIDIVNTHSYTLYNKAATITREFNIAPQPGFANLTIASATPWSDSKFIICEIRVFHPDGRRIKDLFCQGEGDDTRILSPSVDASSGLRVEVALKYLDSELPANVTKNYSFRSRFRFSDTVDPGEVVEPEEPEEPVEPTPPAFLTDAQLKSSSIGPSSYADQTFMFRRDEAYPALVGFKLSSSYTSTVVTCSLQVIGYKTVDGIRVGEALLSDNCINHNRKLFLVKTPDNPTDFEQINVRVRFQNRHVRNSAFTQSTFELIKGAIDDSDADGLPAWYEEYFNLSDNDYNDASIDSDGDGFSNIDEYLGGTDPTDPTSFPGS